MSKRSCRLQNMADSGFAGVDYCVDCKVFHLRIGYATLHIQPDIFVGLCETFNQGLARYRRQHEAKETGGHAPILAADTSLH